MASLGVTQRRAFRQGVSIRAISRPTGLSGNTIRKTLSSGAVAPKFKVPGRPGKLDPFADKLSLWLNALKRAMHGRAGIPPLCVRMRLLHECEQRHKSAPDPLLPAPRSRRGAERPSGTLCRLASHDHSPGQQ